MLDSAIARDAEKDVGIHYTHAGPEIGVAYTKAFATQCVALHLLALARRGRDEARVHCAD